MYAHLAEMAITYLTPMASAPQPKQREQSSLPLGSILLWLALESECAGRRVPYHLLREMRVAEMSTLELLA